MNTPIELRKIIQDKLYPEGVELEFGCRISVATGNGEQRQGKTVLASYQMLKTVNGVAIPDYCEILTFSGSGFEKNRMEDLDIEILGKPTTLQELLIVLAKEQKKTKIYSVTKALAYLLDNNYDILEIPECQTEEILYNLIELLK